MSGSSGGSTVSNEITRAGRELNGLLVDVQCLCNVVTICDTRTAVLNETRRLREETMAHWKRQYYQMAAEYADKVLSWSNPSQQHFGIPSTERLQRLDREATDLAELASELVVFLNENDSAWMTSNDRDCDNGSEKTAVEYEDGEEDTEKEPTCARLPDQYIRFVVVDEQGRPLGGRVEQPGSSTDVRPRDTNGYITLRTASVDSVAGGQQHQNTASQGTQGTQGTNTWVERAHNLTSSQYERMNLDELLRLGKRSNAQ